MVVIFLDALATTIPVQYSTIFVLSGPFFSDPYWDNLHLQATLFDSGRENATRPLQLDVIKGFGDIFCYPCRASNSLVCQTSKFLTNMCSDVWLIEYNRFYLKISLFLTIIWLLFNHRLPVQKGICIKITLFALNMMVKKSLEIFILKSLRFLPQITDSVTKLTFFQHWVSK